MNNAEGLERTIESVLSQNFSSYELIIVDGASTDRSLEVIRKYSRSVAKWVSEPDSGIYGAMNKGIEFASGEYLLFLNSGDTFYSADVLEQIFAYDPKEEVAYGDVMLLETAHPPRIKENQGDPSLRFLFRDMICHQAQFIKKTLFERIGNYDESFRIASDYEFLLRAVVRHHATIRHYRVITACYEMGGLTYLPESGPIVSRERRRAQRRHYPFYLYWSLTLRYTPHLILPALLRKMIKRIVFGRS